ncbi:MAG: hypothetical protein R3C53_04990 [Pirellulaceae bacterium]
MRPLILLWVIVLLPSIYAADTFGQVNPDNIRETIALYESSVRNLAASGTFTVKNASEGSSREFSGTFELMNSDSKFSFTFEIRKTSRVESDLRVFFDENKYQIVGDGENVLVVRFSPSITTGCEASLYAHEGFDYLIEFPEMPIKPSLGIENFSVPKADLRHLESAQSTVDGVEVAYQLGKGTIIKYLLLPEFSLALGRRRVELIDGSLYSLDERSYKKVDGHTIPVAFKHSRYRNGIADRVIELEFDHFELSASNDPELFTINGVDFCEKARIVDNTVDANHIVHSSSSNGFRSSTKAIKPAVAEFRETEQ